MPLKPRIKLRLAELDIKQQKEVAEKLKVSIQSFSSWVTGRGNPTLEGAFKLAKVLDCKVDDLWDYEDSE